MYYEMRHQKLYSVKVYAIHILYYTISFHLYYRQLSYAICQARRCTCFNLDFEIEIQSNLITYTGLL